MKQYKTYNWNRNAATHRDALIKFATIGFVFSGIVSLFVSMALLPQERTNETYQYAVIGLLLTLMSVWLLVVCTLTFLYWQLNETQFMEKKNSLPPPPPRITRVWSDGRMEWVDVETGAGGREGRSDNNA